MQTLAVMNGLGLNPLRLPPVLPPTQTRMISGTLEQELNFETLLGAPHSLANHEPSEATQEMCFSTATLLWRQRWDSEDDFKSKISYNLVFAIFQKFGCSCADKTLGPNKNFLMMSEDDINLNYMRWE